MIVIVCIIDVVIIVCYSNVTVESKRPSYDRGGACFLYVRRPTVLTHFSCFFRFVHINSRIVPQIMRQPFLFIAFPFHFSVNIFLFQTMHIRPSHYWRSLYGFFTLFDFTNRRSLKQLRRCVSTLQLALQQLLCAYFRLMDSFRGADYAHKVRDECVLTTVRVLK